MKKQNNSGLVYSTEQGRICPDCGKVSGKCRCKKKAVPVKTDGIVRISLDRKGRKGKGVSIITGLPLDNRELKELAKKLKTRCGSGGTVKNGVVRSRAIIATCCLKSLKNRIIRLNWLAADFLAGRVDADLGYRSRLFKRPEPAR